MTDDDLTVPVTAPATPDAANGSTPDTAATPDASAAADGSTPDAAAADGSTPDAAATPDAEAAPAAAADVNGSTPVAAPPPSTLPAAAPPPTTVVVPAVPLAPVRVEMKRRQPAADRLIDCSTADPEPALDWRRRTVAVAAFAIVGAGMTAAAVVLRQALPSADAALSETEVGVVLTLMAALMFVVGVGGFGEGYLAGLWLISPSSFGVAAVASVGTYLLAPEGAPGVPSDPLPTIFVGASTAALVTAGGGFLGRALAWRDRAQPSTYMRLRDHFSELCSRYDSLQRAPEVPAFRAEQYETRLAEAYPRLVDVRAGLCASETGRPALRWALASGYSDIARTLHRVEESILGAEPDPDVVGDALHDSLRLSGSTMADRVALHDHLVAAVRALSPVSTQAFFTPLPAVDPAAVSVGAPSALEAREVLREVRFTINAFRDDRIDGLIRARQHLIWTALAAGATTYLLLGLALLRFVPKTQLTGVAAFYLVAALVGLFNRLRVEAGRSSAVEDYGLYLARLITAPLVSGLAGVAGAFLVAKAPQFLSSLTTGSSVPTLSIEDIFDVTKNQVGLVVAAAFGLAPAQLAAALQKQADRFEQDLEKTQASGGSSLSADSSSQ